MNGLAYLETLGLSAGTRTREGFYRRLIDDAADRRLWGNIVVREEGCWDWIGRTDKGYGIAYSGGRQSGAHRHVFIQLNRALGPKEFVDHICRNTLCSNPKHLRAVDPKTNALENSISCSALNAAKTHCCRGHEFEPLKDNRGRRFCRECSRIKSRVYWSKDKNKKNAERRRRRVPVSREQSSLNRRIAMLRPIPSDFLTNAPTMTMVQAMDFYRAKRIVLRRWCEESGADLIPTDRAGLCRLHNIRRAERRAAVLGLLRKDIGL
jgi:hypothetical protein